MPRRWAAMAWLSLFLMLFNIVNAGAIGLRRMEAMADGLMPICSAHQSGASDQQHPPGPSQPASSDCCSCCLSMCCTGAAVPDDRLDAPLPSSNWTVLSFDFTLSAQRRPAPSVGGIARAPPKAA